MSSEFFIIGITILIGYLSLLFADKYKFSQVLLLMLFGFLIGPILGIVPVGESTIINKIYPFMSSLALIILLFDGGISLNIFNVFKQLTKSTIFTFFTFLLNVIFSASLVYLFNYSLFQAIAFGAILGGTSSAIVLAMIERLSISDDMKSTLTIESTISDSLVIIASFILIQVVMTNSFDAKSIAHVLASTFSISIVFGIVGAFVWNFVLDNLIKIHLDYMLTLSVLFILYSLTEAVGANGGFAVFVFALVFGNLKNIPPEILSVKGKQKEIRRFQSEITFFTRTFFFTYIGLLMPINALLNIEVWKVSFVLVILFLISRFISLKLLFGNIDKKDFNCSLLMIPRGLAAAVVVGFVEKAIAVENLSNIVFVSIFLTNLISTIAIFLFERSNNKKNEKEKSKDSDVDKKKTKEKL